MKGVRTDLIIEAEGMEAGVTAGIRNASNPQGKGNGVIVKEEWNKEHTVKVTEVRIESEEGACAVGRPVGTYITLECPDLLKEEQAVKELAEEELSGQLVKLLQGKKSEHVLVVGLGNREVTADAVGPLTVDRLLVTRHFFVEDTPGTAAGKKYRRVSALVPGVTAQTGMETVELIRGVVEEIKPDVVFAVDALAAGSPKRLNTTIQLTDAGISPGAGVGNNRKELNERSLGCPVIAIGVPTVLDAVTIAKEDAKEEVESFFVMARNIDSSVQYVSELLAGGINRVNQKNGI